MGKQRIGSCGTATVCMFIIRVVTAAEDVPVILGWPVWTIGTWSRESVMTSLL